MMGIHTAAIMLSVMLMVFSGAASTTDVVDKPEFLIEAASIQSIELTISPNYGPALGSIYWVEFSIDKERCTARVVQATSYCNAEDGSPEIEVNTYHEQTGDTPDDAFEFLSKQALREMAAHGMPDWVDTGVQDGDVARFTIYTGNGGFTVSGYNADESGPRWLVGLCNRVKRIVKDSGIDINAVYMLYN